jgi:glycine/D-amino acid oxidase-like deaminating enzyme
MIDNAQAVVIGAGALGSSVAFHLAKAGWRRVAMVDRHDFASQTSPRAAGLTAQVRSTDLMTRLAMMAVKKIERFEADTGESITYHQSGSMKIARTPDHEEQLRDEVARGRRLGLDIDFISLDEARRKTPFLEATGIRAVTYTPSDLYFEPVQLPAGYARAASRLGATLLPNTIVTAIRTRDGEVQGVVTDKGEIRSPVVVDAAGAWIRLVGELAGARVPVVPTRHQLFVSEPVAGVAPTQPIVRIIDSNVYLRPEKGGLMLGGYERDPVQYDMRQLPPSFDIKDLPLDIRVLRRLGDTVVDQFPVLRELVVREHRGGLPTMTADGEHLVGSIGSIRGFYVAGGCCVGGLSISPAVGELMARWIVEEKPPIDLGLMAPDRFKSGYGSEEALRAACRRRYSHRYWAAIKT